MFLKAVFENKNSLLENIVKCVFAQDGTRDAEDFSSKFSAVDTRLQEKQYNVGHSAIVPPVFINILQERGCSHL